MSLPGPVIIITSYFLRRTSTGEGRTQQVPHGSLQPHHIHGKPSLLLPLIHKQVAAAAAKSLQSCLTVQPHRRQHTRHRRPWDSPGKNTGVGCHFLLQRMKVKSESEVAQSRPHGLQPTRLLRPWDFPGKSTGVGCHCLLPMYTRF